jgi:hypothetical protein
MKLAYSCFLLLLPSLLRNRGLHRCDGAVLRKVAMARMKVSDDKMSFVVLDMDEWIPRQKLEIQCKENRHPQHP